MRQERTIQATIFEVFAAHPIGYELKPASDWLDGQRALLSLVASDVRRRIDPRTPASQSVANILNTVEKLAQ